MDRVSQESFKKLQQRFQLNEATLSAMVKIEKRNATADKMKKEIELSLGRGYNDDLGTILRAIQHERLANDERLWRIFLTRIRKNYKTLITEIKRDMKKYKHFTMVDIYSFIKEHFLQIAILIILLLIALKLNALGCSHSEYRSSYR